MSSPFFYIMFSLMISSAALSLIFFIAWSNFGRAPHALSWSIAFLAGAAQWAVAINERLFPSHEAYLLTEHAFAIVLVTLGLRGHCQRALSACAPQLLVTAALAVFVVSAWFVAVEPHVGINEAIIPAYAALTLFASSFVIVNYRKKPRPSEWAAAICIALFGAVQAASAWIAAMQGAAGDAALHDAFLHFTFMTLGT